MKQKIKDFLKLTTYISGKILMGILICILIILVTLLLLSLLVASFSIILGLYGSIAGGLVWVAYKIWAAVLLL